MKTLIDTTCPHCGYDISLASIRYDMFSDMPLPNTCYVCTSCLKTVKVAVDDDSAERHISFVPSDEKHEAVWSIIFSNTTHPANPFVSGTSMSVDIGRFMSELTLGTVEHINEITDLYINQSLNQGHLSPNGILCIDGDNYEEAMAHYRTHLTIPCATLAIFKKQRFSQPILRGYLMRLFIKQTTVRCCRKLMVRSAGVIAYVVRL